MNGVCIVLLGLYDAIAFGNIGNKGRRGAV